MIRFLITFCVILFPTFVVAHPNCAAHSGDGEETPFALELNMPAKIVYQGEVTEQDDFIFYEPYDYIYEDTPNERIGLRLPIVAKANQCLGYAKITLEYDGTLWTCVGYESGAPFLVSSIDQYTYDTFNPDVAVTNYCSVTDDSGHDPKSALVFQLYYGNEECVMEANEEEIIVTFLFEANNDWPRNWSGWNTACRFSVMCTPLTQQGLTPLDVAMYPHGNFNHECQLIWGQGVDLWDAETCVIWDKKDHYTEPTNPDSWCAEEDIGDECISCPGCNYNEECNSSLPGIMCNKTPTACLYLVESGEGKMVPPDKRTLINKAGWGVVKGLYR